MMPTVLKLDTGEYTPRVSVRHATRVTAQVLPYLVASVDGAEVVLRGTIRERFDGSEVLATWGEAEINAKLVVSVDVTSYESIWFETSTPDISQTNEVEARWFATDHENVGPTLPNREHWRGEYGVDTNGPFAVMDTCRDGSYLMVANKATTDRPAPQQVGDPTYLVPDAGPFTDVGISATTVISRNVLIPPAGRVFQFDAFRAWLPVLNPAIRYTARWGLFDVGAGEPIGEDVLFSSLESVAAGEWIEVFRPPIVTTDGVAVYLDLIAQAAGANQTFNGQWNTSNRNGGSPIIGEVLWRNNLTELQFSHTDNALADRQAELESVPVGADLDVDGVAYTVTSRTNGTTSTTFTVTPANRPAEALRTFTFTWANPTTLTYSRIPFGWGATGHFGGISVDGGAFSYNTDQFGVDARAVELIASPDWDVQAISSISGGGGSGGGTTLPNYSTSEQVWPQTWINGETIYWKTIETEYNQGTGPSEWAHGISEDFEVIGHQLKPGRRASDALMLYIPYPATSGTSNTASHQLRFTATDIYIDFGTIDRSAFVNGAVTIWYIKI